ncbi:hypothetical protein JCM3775_003390 [Rhodotorula graminis]|uniref:Uncharacterized protein n=1 Tax=Rhodotorula graminis (strain WP1) TaxID=578459 RepID=A0A0P9GHP0_RHOGW|nr:uncharacterized protein RHOBADRAFT_46925 [Rhodotorula graminis WP1]KPV72471.1 hypothetical protein RHOBADRAFT_46925 [Rhodotorula graminis WP1]
MPPFRPTHDQPVTLAQLRLLEPELLVGEIGRLENSIAHLERSNDELAAFVRGDDGDELDDDTRREFEDSVKENEETIARQHERIAMIRVALEEQVGVDASNPHYAVAQASAASRAPPPAAALEGGEHGEVMGVAAASSTTAAGAAPSRTGGVNGVSGRAGGGEDDDDGMYL